MSNEVANLILSHERERKNEEKAFEAKQKINIPQGGAFKESEKMLFLYASGVQKSVVSYHPLLMIISASVTSR